MVPPAVAADDSSDSPEQVRVPMPDRRRNEMFAVCEQLMGGSRMRVMCEDGQTRLARVRGKHKRRMWIREGDLLVIKPWDIQDEKADVTYRYVRTQVAALKRRNQIPENIDIF